ncbi:MAG TPA: CBO0543 family protein [Candidatus Nitrosocosmicus sp.]|nr:CBO0543 family protein [Candidatus Nitrosocosmicus sp.]
MPWVISFISSWVLFFLLTDNKSLKKNIMGGILALLLGSLVDYGGQKLGLYSFYEIIIPWATCSAFYKFGPIFTMGVLFCQHVPQNKWLQLAHIVACSILYILLELSVISTGVAEYLHWNILASFTVNILAFCSLTWFTLAFIRGK